MKSELCKLADIPPEGAHKVDFFGRAALVQLHRGEPVATVAICPHLGGPLEWKDGELVCPWHGARFDGASGACKHWPQPGTAPNRAMVLPTQAENGALFYAWGE